MVSNQMDFLAQDEPPQARPMPSTPVRGEAGMRAALAEHADSGSQEKQHLVTTLKTRARQLWESRRQALSVNDLRYLLEVLDYKGDPRVLASAFPRGEWVPVGYTRTTSTLANSRDVRLFVPTASYAWWRENTAEGRDFQPRPRRV